MSDSNKWELVEKHPDGDTYFLPVEDGDGETIGWLYRVREGMGEAIPSVAIAFVPIPRQS